MVQPAQNVNLLEDVFTAAQLQAHVHTHQKTIDAVCPQAVAHAVAKQYTVRCKRRYFADVSCRCRLLTYTCCKHPCTC
jgi:hypothetical protein